MTFAITARFPLGVFQGHGSDGTAEPLPDPARLHAALLCAAAQGPRAVVVGGRLEPRAEDAQALAWLESNPPVGLQVPDHLQVSQTDLIAYRHEGVIVKEAGRVLDKVTARDQSDGYAISGTVGWVWPDVPDEVREALSQLCEDVGCLGEATSPVVLEVQDVEPNLRLDPEASRFDPDGQDVRVPSPTRTEALQAAHRAANGKSPSEAQDRHSMSEGPLPHPATAEGLRLARYKRIERPVATAPWSQVLLIPTDRAVPLADRVRWCVAVHRALIARIGTGASSMVTGVYGAGRFRPANRLAIQYLSKEVLLAHGYEIGSAFALFLPVDAAPEDRAQLAAALRGWTRVTRGSDTLKVHVERMVDVDATEFWAPVLPGLSRVWVTCPAAVPETRPIATDSEHAWTLADAAVVSVGMVWRDAVDNAGRRGPDQYRHLHSVIRSHGVRVPQISALHPRYAKAYVHATPAGLVVQPYRATLLLGDLAGDRTAVAIGQSRHLGGGLLVPNDMPPDLLPDPNRGA